ncbi:PF2 arrest specific protein [Cyclospora cayetanensis]|uniref:PF2 arrest specific protein n=1 Tax=Cyclospora cayetanensis TaxID=88456 RepID=A0A1D3CU92_9EIME|nr:PF2 arrest specific protein [Cyclospora cayetanensis]
MSKKGKKQPSSKANALEKADPRIAEEEAALERLEAEASKLREEIAIEEAKRVELLKEQHAMHGEWLFEKMLLSNLKEDHSKLHRSTAERNCLHATQTRLEKQRLLKARLKEAAESAAKLLQSQAALVLREQQQIEAKAVAEDFRQEYLEVRAARLLLLGAIRMHHNECLYQARKQAERKEADILLKHKLREAKERALRRSISYVEEQKAQQIADQQAESKKLAQSTKRFFSDVTSASLSLIRQLKKEQEELKQVEARSTKTLAELQATNRSLAEPLNGLKEETEQMQQSLQVYTTELQQIASAKATLKRQEKLFRDLQLQQEVLQQQLIELQNQKNQLSRQLKDAVLQSQQRRYLEVHILMQRYTANSMHNAMKHTKSRACPSVASPSQLVVPLGASVFLLLHNAGEYG